MGFQSQRPHAIIVTLPDCLVMPSPRLHTCALLAASHMCPPSGSYNRVETLPGLDSFADRDESELEARALGPLLTWARAVIPARQLHAVPIFLFATAGPCFTGLLLGAADGRQPAPHTLGCHPVNVTFAVGTSATRCVGKLPTSTPSALGVCFSSGSLHFSKGKALLL